MIPKQKAEELVNRFRYYADGTDDEDDRFSPAIEKENGKKCALIAVDEILETEPRYPSDVDWDDVGGAHRYYYEAQRNEANRFWKQVKQEIEKL